MVTIPGASGAGSDKLIRMIKGDSEYVKKLEKGAKHVDTRRYWDAHERDINVILARTASDNKPQLPKGGLHNRYEGQESAWQLHETVDDFLTRLPVSGSSCVGPWLWVANPHSERDAEPENRDIDFVQRATRLLSGYMDQMRQLTEDNPGTPQGTITRKLRPARDKLKEDILSLAEGAGITTGKWMLFPAENDAPGIWRRIVSAVIENKLGTAAKIATDGSTRLICIYTKDFSDVADVKRVVQQLEKMGLLPPKETGRSIYYKCDAYTHLDIGSGNEYGLQASLYASKDVLAGKAANFGMQSGTTKTKETQADFSTRSRAAGKKKWA
jgi:hypothetical protein